MANVIDSLVNFFQDKFAGQGYSPTQSPQHGVNTTPVDPVKVNWEGMPPRTGVGGGGGGGTDFAREVNWKGIEASKGVPQPTPTAPSAPSGTIPKGFAQPGTTGFAERAAGARD